MRKRRGPERPVDSPLWGRETGTHILTRRTDITYLILREGEFLVLQGERTGFRRTIREIAAQLREMEDEYLHDQHLWELVCHAKAWGGPTVWALRD